MPDELSSSVVGSVTTAIGPAGRGRWRRRPDPSAPLRVTFIELFFDLVSVFAIIQLSHLLLDQLDWRGALEAGIVFVAVWWGWNYSAWATNWVDPERVPVRLVLLALMLLAVVMTAAIPQAFGDNGLVFASAYVVFQVGRGVFMAFACRDDRMGRNYWQLSAWSAIAAVPWMIGAFSAGDARLAWWLAAVLIDCAAPLHGFWLPRRGSTRMSEWTLDGEYLAERNRLVVIIALGETILLLGFSLSGRELDGWTAAAAVTAFVTSAALWWLYFGEGQAEHADHRLRSAADPARLARTGFAYAHALMVAGIIVVAVGVELSVTHPVDRVTTATVIVLAGGPLMFLAGSIAFERVIHGVWPRTRMAAAFALVAFGATAMLVGRGSTMLLAGLVAAVLVATCCALHGFRLPASINAERA